MSQQDFQVQQQQVHSGGGLCQLLPYRTQATSVCYCDTTRWLGQVIFCVRHTASMIEIWSGSCTGACRLP